VSISDAHRTTRSGAPEAAGRRAAARQVSPRSQTRERESGESRKTVLLALAANALIALVKLVGGLLSGSTALLAEAAHSIADTVNQTFLLASLRLARRDADERQPFGHGRERFLWTFVAALGMFMAGAVFALGYGGMQLVKGGEQVGGFGIAWATLVIAALAEGVSWLRALRQTRAGAREAGLPLWRFVRESRDPSVKMVLIEDSAALTGVLIAALGIGADQLTGATIFDPAASMLIGVMLVAVALWLARDTAGLLVGAAARPAEREAILKVLEGHPGVVQVTELLTMVLGPNALLVAARVDLDDRLDGAAIEDLAGELEDAIRAAVPDVTEVFIDATEAHRPDEVGAR
jgi:cation diffusion facilitator family transporter